MIWWKYLLVVVYLIVLFLETSGLIVIEKLVFLNKQIFVGLNTNWEVSTILLWEILPLVRIVDTENKGKKVFLQKWGISVQQKTVANQEKIRSFSDLASSN